MESRSRLLAMHHQHPQVKQQSSRPQLDLLLRSAQVGRTRANRSRTRIPVLSAILAALAFCLCSSTVAADGPVDLTVAGTLQFGGTFELLDSEFGFVDLEVEDSSGAAIFLGIPVNRLLQIELIAVRQDTEVADR